MTEWTLSWILATSKSDVVLVEAVLEDLDRDLCIILQGLYIDKFE